MKFLVSNFVALKISLISSVFVTDIANCKNGEIRFKCTEEGREIECNVNKASAYARFSDIVNVSLPSR